IVFNGEIFNYRNLRRQLKCDGEVFRSGTDTEVLLAGLARHGSAFLERLEGMFAFAFFDPRTPRLLLARDPLGIKPLYLANTAGGGFAFASEVRALLASGLVSKSLDRRGLAGFLAYGAVQHPFTLFEGISSLPPGTFQEVTAQQPTATARGWVASEPQPFWRFPLVRADIHQREAIESVRATLEAAVRDHLIADVPVGVFLSAGLDSTIVAALAARQSPQIEAFTVGFSDYPNLSEMTLAADTAARFGLRHVSINLPAREAEAAVTQWLAAADQPSIDGLNTFVISQAVRKYGIKVALSGLGADELFGGYPSFRDVPRLARVARRMAWLPATVRRGAAAVATARKPRAVGRKLSDMMEGGGRLADIYFHRRRLLSDSEMAAFGMPPDALHLSADYQQPGLTEGLDESDAVRAVSELESRFYQGNMLLRDSDVMGMAHGLEIRVPFLDRRVLETVHALPGGVRRPPRVPGKYLLRSAFADLLRPELTDRPKTGFTLPLAQWMLGPMRDLCERSLLACSESGALPMAAVRRVWDEFPA
ncbi:MAG: asparagine synthase (glutamine-hydrolyzing), partial [Candidatus Saccharimonadales bacterium]